MARKRKCKEEVSETAEADLGDQQAEKQLSKKKTKIEEKKRTADFTERAKLLLAERRKPKQASEEEHGDKEVEEENIKTDEVVPGGKKAEERCATCKRSVKKHRSSCPYSVAKESVPKGIKKEKRSEKKKEQGMATTDSVVAPTDTTVVPKGPAEDPSAFVQVARFDPSAVQEDDEDLPANEPVNALAGGKAATAGLQVSEEATAAELGEQDPLKIYAGGMPFHWTEESIWEHFEYCGEVTDVDMMTFGDSGRFRGIALITFAHESTVTKAIELDGTWVEDFQLKVAPCKKRGKKRSHEQLPPVMRAKDSRTNSKKVFVGNLSWDLEESLLKKTFTGCKITNIKWGEDEYGQFKGFAHVTFEDDESVDKAVEKNGVELMGREMKVMYALERPGTTSRKDGKGGGKGGKSGKAGKGRKGAREISGRK